jgi:AcrR family transcriptional regulator
VESIIQQAGVSKGAFYHHFSSKAEILDAVTECMVAEAMDEIRSAVADVSVGAINRLNRFLMASRSWSLAHFGLLREVLAVLYQDENATMRRKIEAHATALNVPLLADILRQGIEEHVFDPPDPEETARLILQLSFAMREVRVRTLLESGMSAAALAVLQQRVDLYIEMLERMLGARKGSIERLSVGETLPSTETERALEARSATQAGVE